MAKRTKSLGLLPRLRKQFAFLQKDVLAILLFGSHAENQATPRSDIDICLITLKRKPSDLLRKVYHQMDTKGFDVYCFQELPLHLKKEVMDNHQIIYTKNKPDLYEYFYFYRKLWDEQKHRHSLSKKELLAMR